jgi:N-acetylglucosamine-6-phosphate deacetylase
MVIYQKRLGNLLLKSNKLLHIDDKVGSIKVGKDADVVLWITIHYQFNTELKNDY